MLMYIYTCTLHILVAFYPSLLSCKLQSCFSFIPFFFFLFLAITGLEVFFKATKANHKLQPKWHGDCLQHKTRAFGARSERKVFWFLNAYCWCDSYIWKLPFKAPRITGGGPNISLGFQHSTGLRSETAPAWYTVRLLGLGNVPHRIRPSVTPAWLLYTQSGKDVTLRVLPTPSVNVRPITS